MVKPELVIEFSCLDIYNESTKGPISKMSLTFKDNAYYSEGKSSSASVTSPTFLRIRDDKKPDVNDIGISQVTRIISLDTASSEKISLKKSEVLKKEIYVSAEGLVFPCCWLAGQVYKWWRPIEDSQEYKVIQSTGGFEKINVHFTPLQEILKGDFFATVKNSWDIHGVSQGRLKTCGTKCNVGFDPFEAQWK